MKLDWWMRSERTGMGLSSYSKPGDAGGERTAARAAPPERGDNSSGLTQRCARKERRCASRVVCMGWTPTRVRFPYRIGPRIAARFLLTSEAYGTLLPDLADAKQEDFFTGPARPA